MRFQPRPQSDLELNVTPLIDVVFLLLIFFMVSAHFQRESELKLRLPEASSENALEDHPVVVSIAADGRYAVDGRELHNQRRETLLKALQQASLGNKDRAMVVRADALASHQAVINALDAAAQVGLFKISLSTSLSTP